MAIQFTGMEALLNEISGMANVEQAKEKALDAGAAYIQQKIADNTRRSNINHAHAADNVNIEKTADGRVVGYAPEHFYMMFQEFGTRNLSANPVVQPTFDREKDNLQTVMSDKLKSELGIT